MLFAALQVITRSLPGANTMPEIKFLMALEDVIGRAWWNSVHDESLQISATKKTCTERLVTLE